MFEGTDGSGKSTQMRMLGSYLEGKGVPVWYTREPTGDLPIGNLLRSCLTGKISTNEYTIAALFAADRLDHIYAENGILKKLEAGYTVLCDRYYLSSFAYNGGIVPLEWVIELNRQAMEAMRPDLVVYLDLPVEEAMRRIARRGEKERYETLERQRITREKYFEMFERFKDTENVAVVPSECDRELTQKRIRELVEALISGGQQ